MTTTGEYVLGPICATDKRSLKMQEDLLHKSGIARDTNLDYSVGLFDEGNMVATGSCFRNTLRCLAVDPGRRGEALLNLVVTHLIEHQCEQGNTDLFVYTKCDSAKLFADLGFCEVARVKDRVVFMENRKNGFRRYLEDLAKTRIEGESVAGVVINANPFTLGHQYLLEKASKENDVVHVFVVSEDASLIPFKARYDLVIKGTAHLHNLVYHPSGNYMISTATFPSYFLKDESLVIEAHAKLDIEIFGKIAACIGVNRRYVGTEPFSQVTGIYNRVMQKDLEAGGIECIVVLRKANHTGPISASTVRSLIHQGNVEGIRESVPYTTYSFFRSEEGKAIVQRIQRSENIAHY